MKQITLTLTLIFIFVLSQAQVSPDEVVRRADSSAKQNLINVDKQLPDSVTFRLSGQMALGLKAIFDYLRYPEQVTDYPGAMMIQIYTIVNKQLEAQLITKKAKQ